jgi:transcription elongation factor Elf1
MKYKILEKIKQDQQQTTLDGTKKPVKKKQVNYNTKVYCPFCLYYGRLDTFILIDSKDYRLKCPECENVMLMKTLKGMTRMTKSKIQAYAKWCYTYALAGFWNKVNRPIWNERLKQYGWTGIFWSTYRRLKGESNKVYNEEDDYTSAREERIRQKIECGEYG